MKTFSKRLLTMVLAAAMVFGLSGMTTFAAETEDSAAQETAAETETISAAQDTSADTLSAVEESAEDAEGGIQTLADGSGLPTSGDISSGTYTLTDDVDCSDESSNLTVASDADVTIDLDGHVLTLRGTGSGGNLLVQGTLTIRDSSDDESGYITRGSSGYYPISVEGGTLNLESGTIKGITNTASTTSSYASIICLSGSGSTFNMTGGTITGNTCTRGTIRLWNSSSFTMTGGTISDNTVTGDGGAIVAHSAAGYSTADISGGTITGNHATGSGGGIWISSSNVTISGTTQIYDNTADTAGDDIYRVANTSRTTTLRNQSGDGLRLSDGNLVDGWYYDNEGDRWSAQDPDERVECDNLTFSRANGNAGDDVALIAAYKEPSEDVPALNDLKIVAEGLDPDNTKYYDGNPVILTAEAEITPAEAEVSYQWYKDDDPIETEGKELSLPGEVSDSGTYRCVVTVTNVGVTVRAEAQITIKIIDEDNEGYNVKYAVCIWGIRADVDEDGNELGLTFGPAIGKSYVKTYEAHLTEEEYNSGDHGVCLHWMSWPEIVEQSLRDPTVFQKCLENGCTHAVNIELNATLLDTSHDYTGQMEDGDGAGMLRYSLDNNYRRWGYGADCTYPDSQIRATLNGADDLTSSDNPYILDTSEALISCFPKALRDNIVAKEVRCDTQYNDRGETDDYLAKTYDKLWLFSGAELYGGYDVHNPKWWQRPVEGTLYEKAELLGITNTSYDGLKNYYESGSASNWWTRTLGNQNTRNLAYQVLSTGEPGTAMVTTYSSIGIAPGFCLPEDDYITVDYDGGERYISYTTIDEAIEKMGEETTFTYTSTDGEVHDVSGRFLLLSDLIGIDGEFHSFTVTDKDGVVTASLPTNTCIYKTDDGEYRLAVNNGDESLWIANPDYITVVLTPTDKTALEKEYKADIRLLPEDYDTTNWDEFQAAIAAAKEVLDNARADQEAVNDAYEALVKAREALTKLPVNTVNYAVRIWGIGDDTYSYDGGDTRLPAGLTFGPATGDNESGDGTGYINTYKAHLTKEEYDAGDGYCIHWMDWDDIIELSEEDPTVFEDCKKAGCTKSVELTPNRMIFNMDMVDTVAEKDYAGDGPSTLERLLNGTGSTSYGYGAIWNYSYSGSYRYDHADDYSASRIRATLVGSVADANLKYASSEGENGDGSDLCTEAECLLSCFPDELQKAIVPRSVPGVVVEDNDGNTYPFGTDTYDKLWLPARSEVIATYSNATDRGTKYDIFDDMEGVAYFKAYEYNASGEAASSYRWWTRTGGLSYMSYQDAYYIDTGTASPSGNTYVTTAFGLSPFFCLAGPEAEDLEVDVTVTSNVVRDTKPYDGVGFDLSADVNVNQSGVSLSYQWYKLKADGSYEEIPGAAESTYTTGADFSDSGTYKCVVTATKEDGTTAEGAGEITVSISKLAQEISYKTESFRKTTAAVSFINDLTVTTLSGDDGAGVVYTSSDPTLASVDYKTGEVTVHAEGEVTITATALGTENYDPATASYTITIRYVVEGEWDTIQFAVRLWGILADTYSYDEGQVTRRAGLTFGPAVGDNASGDGTGYVNTYKAHLTREQYENNEGYCIHWMDWDEIIEMSQDDPHAFDDCLAVGCTKALELTPNEKLFNMTTVDDALWEGYTGDGVSALDYLFKEVGQYGSGHGTLFNNAYRGYSTEDRANIYSRSRIRTTLTGDQDNILQWMADNPDAVDFYGVDTLCDESNCLLSCFPDELQEAVVPRTTVNTGNDTTSDYRGADTTTTYDRLFLFSLAEMGFTVSRDDSGGEDYNIRINGSQVNTSNMRYYEFEDPDSDDSVEAGGLLIERKPSRTRSRDGASLHSVYYASSVSGAQTDFPDWSRATTFGFSLSGPEPFAFYSDDDHSLSFYVGRLPEEGTEYDGKTVTRLYTDIENTGENPPWSAAAGDITSVVIDSSFADAEPTNLCQWFFNFSNCTLFDGLEYLNTANVTNMEQMFHGCSAVTELTDLAEWDTSAVTSMTQMFRGCTALTDVDVSGWDVSNVTSVDRMFTECAALISLDLTGWDTANMTGYSEFATDCGLQHIILGEQTDLFRKSEEDLVDTAVWYDSPENGTAVSKEYLRDADYPGEYWSYTEETRAFAVYSTDDNSLSFYVGVTPSLGAQYNGKTVSYIYVGLENTGTTSPPGWYNSYASVIKKVEFDASFKEAQPQCLYRWFYQCTNLTEVVGLENLNMSQVTTTHDMFYNCAGLTSLEGMSDWDTGNLTDMYQMFRGCTNLKSMDVSGWNTENVENMYALFYNCESLESVDLSEWDMGNAANISRLFYGCAAITSIGDLSNWDTSKVTDMPSLFYGCKNLTSIDLNGWDTSKASDVSYMFYGCTALTELAVSDWETEKVTVMTSAFRNCSALTTLDLSGWNTTAVTSYDYFAIGCTALDWIKIGDNFDLFYRSTSALVPQQTWYDSDENGNVMSDNYMIGITNAISGNKSGQYWTYTTVTAQPEAFVFYSADDTSLNFYYGVVPEEGTEYDDKTVTAVYTGLEEVNATGPGGCAWSAWHDTATKAVVDESFAQARPISLAYWFNGFSVLTEVTGLENINTSEVTSLYDMFGICYELVSVGDLSGWDTSKVTTMYHTFASCTALETLDISGWDTSNVTAYESFATDCDSLKWIKIGDEFDLFTKSSAALVSQQTWYDSDVDGNEVSNNYLIGITNANSGNTSGQYWTHTDKDAPTVSVTITSDPEVTERAYNGSGFVLSADVTVDPADAVVTRKWYKTNENGVYEAIEGQTGETLELAGDVSDSGTYLCYVTASSGGKESHADSNEITIAITQAAQDISYEQTTVEKYDYDEPFINGLTKGNAVGGAITYKIIKDDLLGGDLDVEIDAESGEVTIHGGTGTAYIVATAAETDNYAETSASYMLIVNADTIEWEIGSDHGRVEWHEDEGEYEDDLTYSGEPIVLTLTITLTEEEEAELDGAIAFQWYRYTDTGLEEIENANGNTLTLEGEEVNAGDYTYVCMAVVAYRNGYADTVYCPIEVVIEKLAQEIDYEERSVVKTIGDADFKNLLSVGTISGEDGSGITYAISGDEGVATVDPESGEVHITGLGTVTVTATAAGTTNYEEASASYTLTVSEAEKELLEAAIAAADTVLDGGPSDYTKDSWDAFTEAYETATGVYDNPLSSQAEVDDATLGLMEAVAGLTHEEAGEAVDRSALLAALADALQLDEGDYTADSWAALADILAEAEKVLFDADASQENVNAAAKAVNDAIEALVNTRALTAAIEEAEALLSDDESAYTPKSLEALEEALKTAEGILADPAASQDEVNEAAEALKSAIANLTGRADTSVLAAAIEAVEALEENKDDYTEDSWEALQEVLAAAKEVAGDANATQEDVNGALLDLITAVTDLVPAEDGEPADKSALLALYAKALRLTEGDYTADTWAVLEDALADAQEVLLDPDATKQAVSDATEALYNAMDALEEAADLSALTEAIEEAEALLVGDADAYTPASWEALEKALATAQEAARELAGSDASRQDDVDAAAAALQEAINALTERADKEVLEAAITTAETLLARDPEDYTEDSWNALAEAWKEAGDVYDNDDASQKEVDDAAVGLITAIANLSPAEPTGDEFKKDALLAAYVEAMELNEEDYTAGSWDASGIEDAIANARTVLLDPDASQGDVSDAEKALTDATGKLVRAVDKSALEAAIDTATNLKEEDYTPESWAKIAAPLANAQVLADSPDASQDAVDAAAAALNAAIGSLEERADTAVLDKAVEAAEALLGEKDSYTEDTWNTFMKAYEAAIALDGNATQEEVDEAAIDLMEAIINLASVEEPAVPSVDKSALFAAYTQALQLNASDYTPASWDAVTDALAAAEALLLDAGASQTDVDAAAAALTDAMAALKEAVDLRALTAAIETAGELLGGDASAYTPASWSDLTDALAAAQEAAEKLAGSDISRQAEADAAAEALEEAINALTKKADKTILQAAIASAKTLLDAGNDNYTEASWDALEKAYEDALAISADENAEQEAVDNATLALMEAITCLTSEDTAAGQDDKEALLAAYTKALQLNKSDYTEESWEDSGIEEALAEAAELLLDPNAKQRKVGAATDALNEAMAALAKAVDISALAAAIGEAEALLEGDESAYMPASWEALAAALDEAVKAEKALAGTDAENNQGAVDDVTKALNEAIGALTERADTTVLNEAVKTAEALLAGNAEDYTPESWKALQDAYDAATTLDAANASQEEVNGVTVDLMNAIVGLTHEVPEVTIDKTELLAAYTEALQLDEADYTAESWDTLMSAVSGAAEVLLDAAASQETVDLASAALRNAIGALEAVVDMSALEAAIGEAESLKEEDYTPESWDTLVAALDEAVAAAETLAGTDAATHQEAVDDAAAALNSAIDALVKKADKTALAAAIRSADALAADKDNYTEDSWDALTAALATATAVNEDVNASQDAVNDATVDLVAAIAGLVPTDPAAVTVDKSALLSVYTEAMGLDEDYYTAESWEPLADALAAAQEILIDPDAVQDDIDAAAKAVTDAMADLVPAVDKSALEAAIEAAKALTEDAYTPESWARLETALVNAQAIAGSPRATQEAVDGAAAALANAIDALQEKADKEILRSAIENAEKLLAGDKDSYTDDSWNALTAAYETAKEVYGDDNASQAAVDDAAIGLVRAIVNLTPVEPTVEETNKSDLLAAYADAMKLDEADYTQESWEGLSAALAGAQEVLLDDTATQDAINDAADALTTAMENLKPAVDMSALDAAIAKAEALTETDYTPNSWDALATALAQAQAVAQSGDAAQDAIDAAAEALEDAIGALIKRADKTALQAAVDAAKALDEIDYTEASWKAVRTALLDAEDVLADKDATQDGVNDAAVKLVTAITNLVPAAAPGGQVRDKATLLTEYVEAMELSESDYTAESWKPFEAARTEAQRVLTDPDATQDEIEAAAEALQAAMENLAKKTGNTGTPKNGLCRIESGVRWGYYVNDKVDTSFTGFVSNENGDWYVQNGYVIFADPSANGVFKDKIGTDGDKGLGTKGTWYYVVRGKVQHDFTGLANYKNENGWWYIKNGVVDFTHNGVDKNKNGWWYVVRGKVRFNFTGLAHYRNANGWWYIKKGKVDFTHNGVDKNQNGWWYVVRGKVRFNFTGLAHYRNSHGWWYINAGKVTFDYNGIASNQNGTWYLTGSKVRFDVSGTVRFGGTTYTVRNGKVN